jgi:hypothetical protein
MAADFKTRNSISPLPPGKNPFAIQLNNNTIILGTAVFVTDVGTILNRDVSFCRGVQIQSHYF